jgi:hypothetical protein
VNIMGKSKLLSSIILLLIFATAVCAQNTKISQTATEVTMENDWLRVKVSKIYDFVAPGSITEVYDRRNDQSLQNNFVQVRWLDLFLNAELNSGESGEFIPDKLRLVRRGPDFITLRSPRFYNVDTKQPFALRTDITYRMVRNRIYVHYEFYAIKQLTLLETPRAASFLDSVIFDKAKAYNWSRKNHLNPFTNLNSNSKVTYSDVIQPGNQVRFTGSAGDVDFHSPDTGLDFSTISKVDGNWILFNEFIPTGNSCNYNLIENILPAGTTIHKTIAILVNSSETATIFQNAGLPSATISPIPYGGTNVMVNLVDDLPTLTFADGEYYNVPVDGVESGFDLDQVFTFLNTFTAVSMDLNLIFDSMLTITQAIANERNDNENTDFIREDGVALNDIWEYRNAVKNVAQAATTDYHEWLQRVQEDTFGVYGRMGLANRSFHMIRLEDVSLAEWEDDPNNIAQTINKVYVKNVLSSLSEDANTIGISIPKVYIPPQLIFNDPVIEPLVEIGTEAMVFCRSIGYPHPVFTAKGFLFALYNNWAPTDKNPKSSLINIMKKGWPVVGLGEYFNGNQNRYNLMVSTFNRAIQLYPNTKFMLAEDYATFLKERHSIEWVRENFDTTSGLLTINFRGSNSKGLTFVVNVAKRITTVPVAPKINGKVITDYRIDKGKIYVTLPELKQGFHTLKIEIF